MTLNTDDFWGRFTDKVLPALFVGTSMSVFGAGWLNHNTVRDLTNQVAYQDRQISELKAENANIKSVMATKDDIKATLVQLNDRLEIVLLRSGVKTNAVRLTEAR